MNYMHLHILFADGHEEAYLVRQFSNISETKSKFYYYEKPNDEQGKGVCIKRESVDCFELTYYATKEWQKIYDRSFVQ